MKDFVSNRTTGLVAWISLVSIIGSAFNPYGLPWPVLAWASLAVAAMGVLAFRSNPSMRMVQAEEPASLLPRPGETRPR